MLTFVKCDVMYKSNAVMTKYFKDEASAKAFIERVFAARGVEWDDHDGESVPHWKSGPWFGKLITLRMEE